MNALCRFLHDDKDLQFDNLVSLIGMDWGETLRCSVLSELYEI